VGSRSADQSFCLLLPIENPIPVHSLHIQPSGPEDNDLIWLDQHVPVFIS
jgi:hypothetical protein